MKIPLSQIDLPEHDLRASIDEDALDELAASFRDHGQLQPIGVKLTSPPGPNYDTADITESSWQIYITSGGRFEVVFGARRTRAAWLNQWTEIEANIVEESAIANQEAKKLIENVQRLDMSPVEEAHALQSLVQDGLADVRRLQQQTGKSREWVKTRLEIFDLPIDLKGALQKHLIGIGTARAFGRIESEEVRAQYIVAAIENGCTTDQANIWATNAKYAEAGIMTMDDIKRAAETATAMDPPADRHYNCFICSTLTNWKRTNTLIVCNVCQDAVIASNRQGPTDTPGYPLDTDDTIP